MTYEACTILRLRDKFAETQPERLSKGNQMSEGAATTMDSNPTTPASVSKQEVNLLNEVGKVFANFVGFLFAIIALINTEVGKSYHGVMLALVFVIVLYFLTLVLGTMLQLHFRNFLPVIVMLLLGSVVTVLSLIMISSTIAWIALALWLFTFALIGYYNHQELHEMIHAKIKNLTAGDTVNPQNPELPETESGGTQSPRFPPV